MSNCSAHSIKAHDNIPEPAPASKTVTLCLLIGASYKFAINFAVSILVKNCPYFFLSFFGILSIYKFVSSIIFSNILSHPISIYVFNYTLYLFYYQHFFRTNVLFLIFLVSYTIIHFNKEKLWQRNLI